MVPIEKISATSGKDKGQKSRTGRKEKVGRISEKAVAGSTVIAGIAVKGGRGKEEEGR
jgi:hypothetical protein